MALQVKAEKQCGLLPLTSTQAVLGKGLNTCAPLCIKTDSAKWQESCKDLICRRIYDGIWHDLIPRKPLPKIAELVKAVFEPWCLSIYLSDLSVESRRSKILATDTLGNWWEVLIARLRTGQSIHFSPALSVFTIQAQAVDTRSTSISYSEMYSSVGAESDPKFGFDTQQEYPDHERQVT